MAWTKLGVAAGLMWLAVMNTSAVAQESAPAAEEQPVQASEAQPIYLNPLTVTGTKSPTPRDAVPATIDVIGPEDLERQQPSTLGDILNDLPGVEVEGGPKGSQSQPNIRGFGGTGWGSWVAVQVRLVCDCL